MTTTELERAHRTQLYWLGHAHGRRMAEHSLADHEAALRLELLLAAKDRHRAFALGELRGYRQATGAPHQEAT